MMEVVEQRKRNGAASFGEFNRSGCRRVFAQRELCAAIVVIAQIICERATQMSLDEHDNVVEALPSRLQGGPSTRHATSNTILRRRLQPAGRLASNGGRTLDLPRKLITEADATSGGLSGLLVALAPGLASGMPWPRPSSTTRRRCGPVTPGCQQHGDRRVGRYRGELRKVGAILIDAPQLSIPVRTPCRKI